MHLSALPFTMIVLFSGVGFPGGAGESPPANAGDAGSIPESGRSPGEGKVTHCSILAWRILEIEETGGLESLGSQRVGVRTKQQQQIQQTQPQPLKLLYVVY